MRSRTSDNVVATTPIAMYAVAQHMLDRGLPAPLSITSPSPCTDGTASIQVGVFAHQVDAWAASIDVDTETVTPTDTVTGYERVAYDGRLPDNGIRITVRCTRRVVSPLRLVPEGAAS
jgi:hypothetical protein